jgi:hypothetical protein
VEGDLVETLHATCKDCLPCRPVEIRGGSSGSSPPSEAVTITVVLGRIGDIGNIDIIKPFWGCLIKMELEPSR